MAFFSLGVFLSVFGLWTLLISPAMCQTCKTQKFTSNDVYAHCLDLPSLSAYLHFSYDTPNSTLSVAFIAPPPKPDGWVAWAINPTGTGMKGSQALVAYKEAKGGVTVNTYDVKSYASIVQSKLSFDVWDLKAEEANGVIKLFGKVKVPTDLVAKRTLNQVWQVGPSVGPDGALGIHDMLPTNKMAKGTLDLSGAKSVAVPDAAEDSRMKRKNIHGILNAVSWGFLFPLGIIIARYMRVFKSADPAWFYLHVSCQVSAYAIGVAGWGTGLKLGSESNGFHHSIHRNIGMTLFALATLQMFALFLRPMKDHKYRVYWNVYHHGVGFAILVLSIINVFRGFSILSPERVWKSTYIAVLAVLAGTALVLEVFTWIVVIRRKSSKSTKPYDQDMQ